jgi:polar amino acid transport system substrate-binding protein
MKLMRLIVTSALIAFAAQAQAGAVDEIKTRGTLLVGVEAKGYGGFIQTTSSGKVVGNDPEISALVAKKLGVKLELVDTAWAGILPALYAKRFDMILGGMTITKARAERVNFSIPYADGSNVVMTRTDSPIKDVTGLTGKIVASQLGSSSLTFLKAIEGEVRSKGGGPFAEVKEYENFPEATLELANRRIDGLLLPKPVALEFIGKQPKAFRIAVEFDNKRYFGAALRKEDADLLAVVNETIKEAKANGAIEALQVKWFGAAMGPMPENYQPTE